MIQVQKRLSKWRQSFVKNGFKEFDFLSKSSKFVYFGPLDFVYISQACGIQTFLNYVWRDFRLPMSALAMVIG